MQFVSIDFETANSSRDSACAVGLVKVFRSRIIDSVAYFIRPPSKLFRFTSIHGIAWGDVANCGDFQEQWPKMRSFMVGAEFLAAHNAPFDRGVLYACCSTFGIPRPLVEFIDTVTLARKTWNIYPTRLPDVCHTLGIPLNHHEPLSDALACARIVLAANRKQRCPFT